MKTDLIILDKNARVVLKILNETRLPLSNYENVLSSNKTKLPDSTLLSILDYLESINYLTRLESDKDMLQPVMLSYPAMYYESLLAKYKLDRFINNVLLPLFISLITSLIVVYVSFWFEFIAK